MAIRALAMTAPVATALAMTARTSPYDRRRPPGRPLVTPYSLLPTLYSLLPIPYSLLPQSNWLHPRRSGCPTEAPPTAFSMAQDE